MIALGGYGRAEQCVFSDIDLLFLFEDKVPAEAEALVREIVYPLWDMGLEVGHATHSIKDCIQLARQDLEVLTSLLDGRFVCGMSPLYHQLMDRMRVKLITVKPAQIIAQLVESNTERHARFGDSAYLFGAQSKGRSWRPARLPHHAVDRPDSIGHQAVPRPGVLRLPLQQRV